MAIFKDGNNVCRGPKIFNGGDIDENRHFIERKVIAHYQFYFAICLYEWKSLHEIKILLRLYLLGSKDYRDYTPLQS